MHHLAKYIISVPDFPKKGIIFKDISPLLRNHFHKTVKEMADLYSKDEWEKIDYVAGIEARGFAIGAALAFHQKKGFIPVRKPGKLPPKVERIEYDLEYGQDALEMNAGTGRVLLVDDVLATGGTMEAAAQLCEMTGHQLEGMLCLVNIQYLNNFSFKDVPVRSLITFNS